MEFIEFVKDGMLILVVAVYIIGMFIKKTEKIKDKYIPLILMGISIIFSVLWNGLLLEQGFSPASILDGFIQGIVIVGVAVLSNQIPKQLSKDE